MAEAKLTSKGQITLPKAIREHLQLRTGDRLEFLVDDDGTVRLWPVTRDVTVLKGMLSAPKRAVSIDDMNRAIRRRAR